MTRAITNYDKSSRHPKGHYMQKKIFDKIFSGNFRFHCLDRIDRYQVNMLRFAIKICSILVTIWYILIQYLFY